MDSGLRKCTLLHFYRIRIRRVKSTRREPRIPVLNRKRSRTVWKLTLFH